MSHKVTSHILVRKPPAGFFYGTFLPASLCNDNSPCWEFEASCCLVSHIFLLNSRQIRWQADFSLLLSNQLPEHKHFSALKVAEADQIVLRFELSCTRKIDPPFLLNISCCTHVLRLICTFEKSHYTVSELICYLNKVWDHNRVGKVESTRRTLLCTRVALQILWSDGNTRPSHVVQFTEIISPTQQQQWTFRIDNFGNESEIELRFCKRVNHNLDRSHKEDQYGKDISEGRGLQRFAPCKNRLYIHFITRNQTQRVWSAWQVFLLKYFSSLNKATQSTETVFTQIKWCLCQKITVSCFSKILGQSLLVRTRRKEINGPLLCESSSKAQMGQHWAEWAIVTNLDIRTFPLAGHLRVAVHDSSLLQSPICTITKKTFCV